MRVPFPVALRSAALLAVLTAVPAVPLSAQGGVVTLRVRSDAGGAPLVNAEVIDTGSVLACEQLADGQSALAFDALDQLREGAERYGHFRRTCRFRVELERRTSREYPGDEQARTDRRMAQANGESWGAPYRPGAVVERGGPGTFSTPILFVHALGDPRFWRHHCITRVERAQDTPWGPVVRLGFEPTRDVRWTDWRGVATLDSASWVLAGSTSPSTCGSVTARGGWKGSPRFARSPHWSPCRTARAPCGGTGHQATSRRATARPGTRARRGTRLRARIRGVLRTWCRCCGSSRSPGGTARRRVRDANESGPVAPATGPRPHRRGPTGYITITET
jgi:hypothetical protein